jgi:hypothetical protein
MGLWMQRVTNDVADSYWLAEPAGSAVFRLFALFAAVSCVGVAPGALKLLGALAELAAEPVRPVLWVSILCSASIPRPNAATAVNTRTPTVTAPPGIWVNRFVAVPLPSGKISLSSGSKSGKVIVLI